MVKKAKKKQVAKAKSKASKAVATARQKVVINIGKGGKAVASKPRASRPQPIQQPIQQQQQPSFDFNRFEDVINTVRRRADDIGERAGTVLNVNPIPSTLTSTSFNIGDILGGVVGGVKAAYDIYKDMRPEAEAPAPAPRPVPIPVARPARPAPAPARPAPAPRPLEQAQPASSPLDFRRSERPAPRQLESTPIQALNIVPNAPQVVPAGMRVATEGEESKAGMTPINILPRTPAAVPESKASQVIRPSVMKATREAFANYRADQLAKKAQREDERTSKAVQETKKMITMIDKELVKKPTPIPKPAPAPTSAPTPAPSTTSRSTFKPITVVGGPNLPRGTIMVKRIIKVPKKP